MATTEMVAAVAAKGDFPGTDHGRQDAALALSWCRIMFSNTMMASSTTIPMERLSPRRVKVFKVNPAK